MIAIALSCNGVGTGLTISAVKPPLRISVNASAP
jgi:hypothetical protein